MIVLMAVMVMAAIALSITSYFKAEADEAAKKMVMGKAELAYHITIDKVPITVVGDQLAVNGQ